MRARVWLGFAFFCLLSGSRWLLDEAVLPPVPPLARSAMHHAILLLLLGLFVASRPRSRMWLVRRRALWIGLCGVALFAVPDAVIAGAGGRLTGMTEALVFTLMPTVVVIAVAQQSWEFGAQADPRQLLGPSLAGVFGAALLIPFTMPPSPAGKVWLGGLMASAVLAGLAAVRLHALLRGSPIAAAAVVTCAGITVTGVAGTGSGWSGARALNGRAALLELAIALCFDGPLLMLGLWLLREMSPVGFATRIPLVLLVAIGEGYALLHGSASWPMDLGVLLMAGSAAWLLRQTVTQAGEGSTSCPGPG